MTLDKFEKLLKRAWKAYDRFEKTVEYKENSHEIVKGLDEDLAYRVLKNEVEAHAGAFPYLQHEIEWLP